MHGNKIHVDLFIIVSIVYKYNNYLIIKIKYKRWEILNLKATNEKQSRDLR